MTDGFFDTHARLTSQRSATASPAPGGAPLTVTQLTKQIEKAIKSGVPASLSVRGEVSNYRPRKGGSGHLYFTMKDAAACIDCVMWADAAAALKFTLTDGLEVLASGRVGIYADRGKYQLYVNSLSPMGKGALELAFQQLRARLEKEGLFSPERKKPLPVYPLRICLVTSRGTAAIQDMFKVLNRYPWLRLFVYDVPVQGGSAAPKIAAAIAHLNHEHESIGGIDAILLARGGGSPEDLWAFNEEIVARAVAESEIPIVTGIGHEIDVSIADLVADHHAHTPTEAAQTVVAQWRSADDELGITQTRLRRAMRQMIQDARQRLTAIERHELFRRPMDMVNQLRQRLDDRERALALGISKSLAKRRSELTQLESRLTQRHPRHTIALYSARVATIEQRLSKAMIDDRKRRTVRLDALQAHLNAVGPEQVLLRGYTITTTRKNGVPMRSAADAKLGQTLVTRFADGEVESIVADPKKPTLF